MTATISHSVIRTTLRLIDVRRDSFLDPFCVFRSPSADDISVSLPEESSLSLCSLSHPIMSVAVHIKKLEVPVPFTSHADSTAVSTSRSSSSNCISTSLSEIIMVPFTGSSFCLLLGRNKSIVHCLLDCLFAKESILYMVT